MTEFSLLMNGFYLHQPNGLNLCLQQENDLKKTVDESARIRRAYSHYFDLTIVNDNLDKAFDKLQEVVERLFIEPQWVPVSWVYWCVTDVRCPSSWAWDEKRTPEGKEDSTLNFTRGRSVGHQPCVNVGLAQKNFITKAESPWSELPDSFQAHYATHHTQEVYLFIGKVIF